MLSFTKLNNFEQHGTSLFSPSAVVGGVNIYILKTKDGNQGVGQHSERNINRITDIVEESYARLMPVYQLYFQLERCKSLMLTLF